MPSDYVPYGPDWEAEMMRMRKADLVDMVRRAMVKVENGSSHNKQSTSASQIADSMQAACIFGNDFVSSRESWVRKWIQQLRTL
jgi:hypothetical protein